MNTLGDYIKRIREHRDIEQQDLAARIGRTASWLSEIERGRKKGLPEPEELRTMASVLQVSMVDLLQAAGYITRDDLEKGSGDTRNPFVKGDPRYDAVELLLDEDPAFQSVVSAVLRIRRVDADVLAQPE